MASGCHRSRPDFKHVFERRVAAGPADRRGADPRRASRPPRRHLAATATATSAVVTGAARGIGRAVAVRLVAAGHHVVITDLDADAVAATAAEIGATGLAQDVRDADSHRAVAEAAVARGPLAVWVNNAGVGWDGDLVDLTDEQVRGLVEINLLGVLWGMRAALDAFARRPGGGSVVNVASLSGLGPVPGLSTYAATKAAVVSITASVALEAPDGVGVHAVLPDGVATALVEEMSEGTGKKLVLLRAAAADHRGGRRGGPRAARLATRPAHRCRPGAARRCGPRCSSPSLASAGDRGVRAAGERPGSERS